MISVRPGHPSLLACMALLVTAGPGLLTAQPQRFEGKKVINIRFDPPSPAQPLAPEELFEILPLRTGEPLQMIVVRASIERLFATGRYADSQVNAEPYDDGVIDTFRTKNRWFIGSVNVFGRVRDPPNGGQLANATRLELGRPYTESGRTTAVAGQQRLLESNGLFNPQIAPNYNYDELHQQINFRFDIDSGRRARFYYPVLTGDLRMDPGRILTATRFRRWLIHTWKPMTQRRVRRGLDGVRSLYQKDDRLEAKVTLESMRYDPEANRAIPTIHIDAGPRIKVNTIGAHISQSTLRRLIPIFEERAVDHDLLVEGANNLKDYLQSQGYFDAQVELKQQAVVNDQANLDFLIATGKRHQLVAIHIEGNRYFTTEVIRSRMFLQTANLLQFPHGRFSTNYLKRDVQTIHNLYESNGFRDVKVTTKTQDDYRGKPGDLAVFIYIEEGPQYLVNSVQIEGVEKMDRAQIYAKLTSSEGQPFSEFNVAVDRDAILARYFEQGFPKVTFEWSSKPAADPHRVDLVFRINEGQQQFVREVLINSDALRTTRPELISRQLQLNPGDPLSPVAIAETQRRLYDLGIFARVDAAIQNPDGEETRKYVLYNIEEAARYSIAFGFGVEGGRIGGCQTCFDAPIGQTGVSPRVSMDITRINLWGRAHTVSLRTRASTLEQRALLNYNWPRFQGHEKLSLNFTALYENSRDVRTFNFKREEASMQFTQRLTKATSIYYGYTWRHVSVSNVKVSPLLIPLLSQPVGIGLVTGGVIYDRRDDPVDSHRGIYTSVDVAIANHIFGSQRVVVNTTTNQTAYVDFGRILARNSTYHPITRKIVFARSTMLGNETAFNGNTSAVIPLPERFFGGGGTTHRGFPYNQAGPRDINTGFPVGGTFLLFNQHEMRFPLIGDNVGGVLFHDFGNIYSTINAFSLRQTQRNLQDFNYMVHAVGFGVRYHTPIGPFRLDLAYSINPPYFIGFQANNLQDLIDAGVNPCQSQPQKCVLQHISHFQVSFSIGQTF